MRTLTTGEIAELLVLPEQLEVQAVFPSPTYLMVRLACSAESACCPQCQVVSQRIHSKYGRTLADLPCGGRRVILKLSVRKFVCGTATCPYRIFTERLPKLTQPYARMTNRLRAALQALGCATSGEAGARVAEQLGMPVTAARLIRSLRQVVIPPPSAVRIVGIDDWCWKRGQTYGTILVDLERRKPIEVLPDRQAETVEAWLRLHPEIEVVSRDRGGEYAAAARRGAPQAQQIADRFHLLLNLREKLKEFLARKQKLLPHSEANTSDAIPEKARGALSVLSPPLAPDPEADTKSFRKMTPHLRAAPPGSTPSPPEEMPSQVSRSNRYARYEAVHTLHQQALSEREIAHRLKMSRKTVHQFLVAVTFPERSRAPYCGSILDPYKPYILDRWKAGCWNGTQLYSEVKQLGYTGSEVLCRLFITSLRQHHQAAGTSSELFLDIDGAKVSSPVTSKPVPSPQRRISATRASWLCVCQPAKLDEKQCRQVEQIRAAHGDLDTAYRLSQTFVLMLAEHRDQDLDEWLMQAKQSGIRELKSFAQGIRRDYAAVRAAFTSEWSNGQTEAQVNCLKLQKRIMFGRANFDLLRLRVLSRA
ncbi:MAG TPA: ISL3 family transposase [Ktedonobacteraceae bacterium]